MEITSEIYQIGGHGYTDASDAAVYLIDVGGRAALVDAGCGQSVDRLVDHMMGHGVFPDQVDYLLLTHCHFDHTGGAQELKQRLSCQVVCHQLEAQYLMTGNSLVTAASWYGAKLQPVSVDVQLSGQRQTISLGSRSIEAIHIPGHSPGSVVYLMESDGQKVLFGQDVHGPIHPDLLSNQQDYQKSLKLLLSLEADVLCEGHFGVFKGKNAVAAFIQSYIRG